MARDNILNGGDEYKYLIVRPQRAGISDLWRFWRYDDQISFSKFIDNNFNRHNQEDEGISKDHRWVIIVSAVIIKLLGFIRKPLKWFGYFVDFLLNLISLNGDSVLSLLLNFLLGKLIIPQRGTSTFVSSIGHLDGRINLDETDHFGGTRSLMDLCIMASKLAYENAALVKLVVINTWKMHFVDFYNGWNDYQQEISTQAFILTDKPVNANLILISFRGTEPFNSNNWSTDFEYSWYEIPQVGKIHLGFLEALGLGNRENIKSFHQNLQAKDHISRLNQNSSPYMGGELTAYYAVRNKLKELLAKNSRANFVVTGHSLGGALAILFPTVLVLHDEKDMLGRLLAVYTFGQPRVGNRELGNFIQDEFCKFDAKYFRLVYCNDIVPRVPYDDKTFLYKHFGDCLYYDSFYTEQKVEEEPNKNFLAFRYLIPAHVNAAWELIRGLAMHYIYGLDYEESWFSILARIVGLALPGLSAHSPRDYVNSVRLGAQHSVVQM